MPLCLLEVVHGDQRRDDAVEDAFGHLVAVLVEHGAVRHQVPDVADQHQAAAVQGHLPLAIGCRVDAIRVEPPRHRLAALVEGVGEIALHQAEPFRIGVDLVGGVDGGDRIFQVHDRGDGRLEHDVLDAGGVGLADRMRAVDGDLDMHAVVHEQDRGSAPRRCPRSRPIACRSFNAALPPPCSVTASEPPSMAYLTASTCEPDVSGAAWSRNSRAQAMTLAPRTGL